MEHGYTFIEEVKNGLKIFPETELFHMTIDSVHLSVTTTCLCGPKRTKVVTFRYDFFLVKNDTAKVLFCGQGFFGK